MFIHWGNHANKRLARTGSHFAGRAPKARVFGCMCVSVISVCACATGQEKILELVDSASKRPAFQHNHACSALTRPHHWWCFSLQVALLVVFCKVYPMDDGIFLSTSLPLALFLGLLLCHLSTSQRTSRSSVFLASLASAPLVDIHSIVEEFLFTLHFSISPCTLFELLSMCQEIGHPEWELVIMSYFYLYIITSISWYNWYREPGIVR